MATASEILAKVNDLLDGYSEMLAPDGGSKILMLDRAAGSDVALSRLREDGAERWRYGMLSGDTDFVLQWSTDGSELNYTDRLRIDGATGAVTIAGLSLDAVDITGGAIDGTTIGGTTPAAGVFTTLRVNDNVGIGIDVPQAGLHTLAGVATNAQVPAYSWLGDIGGARWVSGLGSFLLSYFSDNSDTASLPERGSVAAHGTTFRSKIGFTGQGSILAVGNARFGGTYAATTASAANMVVDASGNYQRSTSSEQYKRDIEPADPMLLRAVVMAAEPIWYRSLCDADPDAWSWWGLSAEAMAAIDPRFVQWRTTAPVTVAKCFERVLEDGVTKVMEECEVVEMQPLDPADYVAEGVAYERLTVALISVVQDQQTAIADLAARVAILEEA